MQRLPGPLKKTRAWYLIGSSTVHTRKGQRNRRQKVNVTGCNSRVRGKPKCLFSYRRMTVETMQSAQHILVYIAHFELGSQCVAAFYGSPIFTNWCMNAVFHQIFFCFCSAPTKVFFWCVFHVCVCSVSFRYEYCNFWPDASNDRSGTFG